MKKKIRYIVEELFTTVDTNDFEKRKKVFEDIVIYIIKKKDIQKTF